MKIRRLPLFLSATTFVYIFNSCCGGVHAQHVHVEEQKVIEENNAKLLSLDLGDERGDSYALPSLRGRRRRNLSIEGTVTATITNSTSNDDTIADGIDSKESVGRQIILLAGPHKTASTTMVRQKCPCDGGRSIASSFVMGLYFYTFIANLTQICQVWPNKISI